MIAKPAIVVCLLAGSAFGAGPVDGDRDFTFYLGNILAERQKLHSGVYTVSGSRSVKLNASEQGHLVAEIDIFCAFDEDRLRLDNAEGHFVADATNASLIRTVNNRRKYFHTKEEDATWVEDQNTIWTDRTPDNKLLGRFLALDPRALGVATFRYVTDYRGHKLESTITGYANNTSKKSVEELGGGHAQLVLEGGLGVKREELRLWVAADAGFTVTRLEAWTHVGTQSTLRERANVSWKQVTGTWVPAECQMSQFRPEGEQSLAMKFDWREVNSRVDATHFTLQGLNVPEAARLIDMSGDDPILVREKR